MSTDENGNSKSKNRSLVYERIITGVAGAVLLALQGVNISETGGNHDLIRNVERALDQQTQLIKELNQEGIRVDAGLKNQLEMIKGMDQLINNQNSLLKNQGEMIELLKKDNAQQH
jgi:hypothetical protein